MTLKLRTLPILEQWDCHHCTACCRETTILLTPDDLARLRGQQWDQHPDYRGIRTVESSSWLVGKPVLAHRPDGSCVFLTEAGRCRIHELFGPEAKPFMCRQFPLQVVATDRGAVATVVRSCPSAAADRGRPLDAHLSFLRRLLPDKLSAGESPTAPPILRRTTRGWDDFHHLAGALERLVVDGRFPLVRRLVHGLRFCALVDECKWKGIVHDAVAELAAVLEQSATNDVGPLFQDRQPPSPAAARLFRRLGAHFIRCVPGGRPTRTWLDHWRVFRASGQLARTRGQLPELHPRFPTAHVDQLERPLGPLAENVLHPLDRFYESQAISKRYVLTQANFSLVDSFRTLAFTFPMALWMLRWLAVDRDPAADDMVQIVVALERGYVLPALNSAAGYLAESGELERLMAWYGR
ncbi:MAG: YkgJ family cysteine cluster protein [Pirellulales bacterium]